MATVLVVDDDSAVRQLVVTILKLDGHTVMSSTNGLEALMVYSSYRSRLDLVLTDIDMPELDGIELVARIRALDSHMRVLLMSGRPSEERIENCPMLPKPFKPDELKRAVNRALRE
jgi:CheY-like chemotaxis protein